MLEIFGSVIAGVIFIALIFFGVLQWVDFFLKIYHSNKKNNYLEKVERTNSELLNNRPVQKSLKKFEHWKKFVEQRYVYWGKSSSFFSTVKYPPDWNMRKLYIAELYNYSCAICGKTEKLGHTHHIKPLSAGGNNGIDNLVYLCRFCHEDQHWHLKLKKDIRRKEVSRLGVSEEQYLQMKKEKFFKNKWERHNI